MSEEICKRIDQYIEYATATKRFADVGFYEELKRCIQSRAIPDGYVLARLDDLKVISDCLLRSAHPFDKACSDLNAIIAAAPKQEDVK